MKKLLLLLLIALSAQGLRSQDVVSVTLQEELSRSLLDFILPVDAIYGIRSYKIIYTTTDVFGEPTEVSGLITVPFDTEDELVFPLCVYNHGTSGTPQSVPSRQGEFERNLINVFATNGYIMISPDYLGLGESEGIHPYVHADSEAQAGRDMLLAVRSWLAEEEIPFNNQLFLTGYSQGGHASMALHRDLELNPGDDDLIVTAAAHLSGPYSISDVMTEIVTDNNSVTLPGYLAYTYVSYNYVYQLYDDLSAVFVAPYLSPIQAFEAGTLTLNQVNQELTLLLETEQATFQDMLQDSIVEILASDSDHPMRLALEDNDVYEWAPEAPTVLVYCTADEQVPFRNAILADSVMTALGSTTVQLINGGEEDHGGCVSPAATFAVTIFSGFADVVSSVATLESASLQTYPNPLEQGADLWLKEPLSEGLQYDLISTTGQLMTTGYLPVGSQRISVPDLPKGLYFLRGKQGGKAYLDQILIQ